MELKTNRLKLSELTAADLNDIHYLHSLPEVDEFNTLGIPGSIQDTSLLLADWMDKQNTASRESYIFCIRITESNQFVGLIALNLGKLNFRIAEIWYKILPSFWGQGYATEALKELLKFGFSALNLHRIEAGCAIGNIGSIKVLEKVGMIREGSKRKILPIRGQWVDNYFYSILDTDFEQR